MVLGLVRLAVATVKAGVWVLILFALFGGSERKSGL